MAALEGDKKAALLLMAETLAAWVYEDALTQADGAWAEESGE